MADSLTLTTEIAVVLALLAFTMYLFVSEIVRVDVAAVSIMVLLGLTTMIPGLEPLISPDVLFTGFSSNCLLYTSDAADE